LLYLHTGKAQWHSCRLRCDPSPSTTICLTRLLRPVALASQDSAPVIHRSGIDAMSPRIRAQSFARGFPALQVLKPSCNLALSIFLSRHAALLRWKAGTSSNCAQRRQGVIVRSLTVEAPWWQAQSPVTSHLRQRPQWVTFLLTQREGCQHQVNSFGGAAEALLQTTPPQSSWLPATSAGSKARRKSSAVFVQGRQ
jgi:hypothetical protein